MIDAVSLTFSGVAKQGRDGPSDVTELNNKALEIAAAIEEEVKGTLSGHAAGDEPTVRAEISFASGSLIVSGAVLVIYFSAGVLHEAAQQQLAEIIRMSVRRILVRYLAPYGFAGPDLELAVRREHTPAGARDPTLTLGRAATGLIAALLVVITLGVLLEDGALFLLYRTLVSAGPSRDTAAQQFRGGVSTNSLQTNQELYLQAIARAALKTPQQQLKLLPIDVTQPFVTFVSLSSSNPVDGGTLRRDTWVSLPSELHHACQGKRDPLLAIEQILGLPPYRNEMERQATNLWQFTVARSQVFRPCVSAADITTDHCNFDDIVGEAQESAFVLKQIWQSYRIGFGSVGYPFTGMGWSYNWDPASQDHVGISEYVVRHNAPVSEVKTLSPTEFCGAQ